MILTMHAIAAETISVTGEVTTPADGMGTEEKPYRYFIDEKSKVAWKHLLDNRQDGISEVYECRENNAIDGTLIYSYTMDAKDILANVSGPYFLEIRFYDEKATKGLPGYPNAMFFSFATKRDFPGKTKVTINVSNRFKDGEKINLTYYGGYDSTVIHGAAPIVAEDEIRQVDTNAALIAEELMVENGLVAFDVRYGGNYLLHKEPVDFSEFGISEVMHYDADKVLGSIQSVFPTEKIAQTIASKLGKKTSDTIVQGDIDSIKSLYLSAIGLDNTEELERVYFSRLESLTLSDNELESLNSLSMPALTYLDVSGNRLKSVNALAKLEKIENVNLTNNVLLSLPDLNQLNNLQTLDLSHNNLQVIPMIKSSKLRFLDISGNAVTWVADLKECTSLDKMVFTGQMLSTESEMDINEAFHLNPKPRFISQFGNSGKVTIINSHDKKIYEEDFSVLESNDFCLEGKWFSKSDEYYVDVTGTVLQDGVEEKLGTYHYKVIVGDGKSTQSGTRKMIAFSLIIVLVGFGVRLALYARQQKNK